jgi:hypothetical protein
VNVESDLLRISSVPPLKIREGYFEVIEQ